MPDPRHGKRRDARVGSAPRRRRRGDLRPDLFYSCVHAIDLEDLRRRGIRNLLVDLDNTLLPRDTNEVPEDLKEWARRLEAEGFRVVLISNNWRERVKSVADELGFGIVPRALKPLPFAFRRAVRMLSAMPHECAVVGDQIFTDVLGGSISGMTTVLVQPLSAVDLPHTLALRLIERRVMADREPLK